MTTKTNNNLDNHHKKNLGNLPIWDLSDLYDSIESKKISSDLEFIEIKAKEFEKNYEWKKYNSYLVKPISKSKFFMSGGISMKISNINHNTIQSYYHQYFYLNNFFNPSLDASQTPFSVINPVTYFAGVTSKAIFIALLFFG